jgi:hypothetical protein
MNVLQVGDTPLMIASAEGYVSVCEVLLGRGADIDHEDKVYDIGIYYYTVMMYGKIIITSI